MLSVCMRYANSTDEAEDMLIEGFYKVLSNLEKYDNTGSFESWMKRVMVHAAIDHRRKYDPPVLSVDIDDVLDASALGYDVNTAMTKMNTDDLVSMIQQLPPMSRMVFNLFVFDGFTHAEISQQLSITEGTSAWHVNNARTRLKNEIYKRNKIV